MTKTPTFFQYPQRQGCVKARLSLAADGRLIQRPILDDGKNVLVGFDDAAYAVWARQ